MTALQVERPTPNVVRLVMTQPARKNAMNAAMREALREQIAASAQDPSVEGMVLTGAAGNFSAGGDLQGLVRVERADFRRYLKRGHELVLALWNFEKPAIAAIQGVAVGGGLALAMCCDTVIAGRSARLGFTFVRIGFVPDWGTLYTVAQRVGTARARQLFLSGELVDAERALDLGLVDEVVDDVELQDAAVVRVGALARQPKRAYAYTKRFLQSLPTSLEHALEFEAMAQENCFKSDDFLAAVAPFLDSTRERGTPD